MKRHFLHLFLALALIVGGLSVPALAQKATGGYVEKEIQLPDGYTAATPPVTTPDGGFAVAAAREDTRAWALIAWTDPDAQPTVTPLAAPGYVTSIDYAPDGQLMAVCEPQNQTSGGMSADASASSASAASSKDAVGASDSTQAPGEPDAQSDEAADAQSATAVQMVSSDDRKIVLAWMNPDGGTASTCEISGMFSSVRALSGRRAAAMELGTGVSLYDESGEKQTDVEGDDAFGMASGAGSLWLQRRDSLTQYAVDGAQTRSVPLSAAFGNPIAVSGDGAVYILSTAGILRLAPGGESFEKIADASNYAFGDPSETLSGLCALKSGTLVAMLGGGNGVYVFSSGGSTNIGFGGTESEESARLVAYVFDLNLDLSNRENFTVTALRASAKLRKAVSEFQRAHPELNVNLNAKLEENDDQTPVEDAVRALNTDLLAGNGGDVLVLDGLPADKYTEKGVLQDLTEFSGDLGILPGILSGSKAPDGKIYALPAQFAFTTLWGRRDQAGKVTDLQSILNLPFADGQTPMYGRTPEDWLRLLFPASGDAFRDESGNLRFDSEAFASFLNVVDGLYMAQAEQPDESTAGDLNMEELQALMNGSTALAPGEIASTMQAAIYYTVSGEKDALPVLMPSVGGAGSTYTPSLRMGVSAWTGHKDLAEAFIRSIFTPNLQELDQSEGLPTVAASLDKVIENAKALAKNKDVTMGISLDGSTPLTLVQPDDACWDALRALCDRLHTSALSDETLLSFLTEETKPFFDGTASASDAARAMAARATAYLNE